VENHNSQFLNKKKLDSFEISFYNNDFMGD